MTIKEYKDSVSDIRALINDRGRLRSKFGLFTIDERRNLYGIWNCLSKNVIVAINRNSHLIRVREASVYLPALSNLDGWRTAKSGTLAKYHQLGNDNHVAIYLNHIARPQYEYINRLKTSKTVTIDLGPDDTLRANVRNRIKMQLTEQSYRDIVATLPITSRMVEANFGEPGTVDDNGTINIISELIHFPNATWGHPPTTSTFTTEYAISDLETAQRVIDQMAVGIAGCGDADCEACNPLVAQARQILSPVEYDYPEAF